MAESTTHAIAAHGASRLPNVEIDADGAIDRGAQNPPGNWESNKFNLPARLREAIPAIGEHETAIVMHNDAVVQGLSEVPFMTDVHEPNEGGRVADRFDGSALGALNYPHEMPLCRLQRSARADLPARAAARGSSDRAQRRAVRAA